MNGINCVDNNATDEAGVVIQMNNEKSNKENSHLGVHGSATVQHQNITQVFLQETHSSTKFFIVGNILIIILMVAFIGFYVYSNRQKICNFYWQTSSNVVEFNDVVSITSEGAFLKTTG